MAIAFSCPACERDLKVKDELSGRKIRCPKCEEVIAVPSEDEDEGGALVAAAPSRKATRDADAPRSKKKRHRDEDADDADLEEERPRKKKKKKDNTMLWIRIGVLAGLLIILGVLIVLLVKKHSGTDEPQPQAKGPPPGKGPFVPPGDGRPPPGDGRPGGDAKPPVEPPRKPHSTGIRRAPERVENGNTLKQLALAYLNYCQTYKKAPTKWEDLEMFYEKNPQITESLKTKYFTFHYGVLPQQMTEGTSRTLLAYETDRDQEGIRVCVFADGHVDNLDEGTFQQTPKAMKK